MIAIIDYGMGNLRSVQKALEKVGANALITQDINDIQQADKIVLPGVGAIKPAIDKLNSLRLIDIIKKSIEQNKPFLGICLGLQLLLETSDEGGTVNGLGIIKGAVKKFYPSEKYSNIKIPHIGWNQVDIKQPDCRLFKGIENNTNFYFCHSFFVNPQDSNVIATETKHGIVFSSSICKKNIFGVQFHPEKSQKAGLKILDNFNKI